MLAKSLGLLTMAFAATAWGMDDFRVVREPDKSVAYKTVPLSNGQTADLLLHVFLPPDHKPADKRPAIVFFSGGAWMKNEPEQFFPHAAYLASRGMVAMSAQYRVKQTHNTTPRESVKDAKSAIRWARLHAAELGIDPNRLAAGGGSAGGQMAAAAGTTKAFEEEGEDLTISSRPDALVLFNPVFDNGPGGYGHGSVKPWRDFSPMHNIDQQTPPTIVFFGTRDKYVPMATAEKYKAIMEEHGRRCDLHLYEGQNHGFFSFREDPRKCGKYNKTVEQMDRFLASLGYLQGEPTVGDAKSAKKVTSQ